MLFFFTATEVRSILFLTDTFLQIIAHIFKNWCLLILVIDMVLLVQDPVVKAEQNSISFRAPFGAQYLCFTDALAPKSTPVKFVLCMRLSKILLEVQEDGVFNF